MLRRVMHRDRYFDAHVYFANWGSRRLMFVLTYKSAEPAGPSCLPTLRRRPAESG
jgi:hypothetical protein